MDFEQFKTDALRTESRPERLNFSLGGTAMLLSVCVQMAHILDTAKKTIFYGKPFNEDDMRDQIRSLQDSLTMLSQRAHNIAVRDDRPHPTLTAPNLRIAHGAIGMFGEAGELIEAVLKSMQNGGQLDMVNLAEETGDSDWYKAIIHDETGVSEDDTRAKVIAKLKQRYGDKFSSEAALNRDLDAERKVLEETTA